MHGSYHRKVLPILSEVSRWQVICNYDCNCCTFSTAIPDPQSMEERGKAKAEHFTSDKKDVVMDSFTDKLIQQKSLKWKSFVSKTRLFVPGESSVQLSCYQKGSLVNESNKKNNSEQTTINSDEIKHLLNEFQRIKVLSENNVLDLHKQEYQTDRTESENLDLNSRSEEYKTQTNNISLAQEMWRKENYVDALNLFWNVYSQNNILHKKIKYILLGLMADAIPRKGEAVLVLIINFSKKVAEEYADYIFLSYVWEHCFLSEWHSDNVIANSLLEEYPELKITLQRRVHHITYSSLLKHKVEVTQRLFEVLLKYEMKTEYELVLRSLFDYACLMMDSYACSAIIQSCHDLDVTLTVDQNSRFVLLFSRQGVHRNMKQNMKIWTAKLSKFNFKF